MKEASRISKCIAKADEPSIILKALFNSLEEIEKGLLLIADKNPGVTVMIVSFTPTENQMFVGCIYPSDNELLQTWGEQSILEAKKDSTIVKDSKFVVGSADTNFSIDIQHYKFPDFGQDTSEKLVNIIVAKGFAILKKTDLYKEDVSDEEQYGFDDIE